MAQHQIGQGGQGPLPFTKTLRNGRAFRAFWSAAKTTESEPMLSKKIAVAAGYLAQCDGYGGGDQ